MKRFGWLLTAARNPVESILFIFSLSLMAYAIFVMSPAYPATALPGTGAVLADAEFPTRVHEFMFALFFLATSIPGTVAPFLNQPTRDKYLKYASFGMFITFLFLTILRLVIYGFTPLSWLPLLAISLACGVFRLWLEVKK